MDQIDATSPGEATENESWATRNDSGFAASISSTGRNDGTHRIDSILGFRCLAVVLSFLDEVEGTSFLLCQKRYWTDTILPLLRLPPEPKARSQKDHIQGGKTEAIKYRHRMSGRYNTPIVRIPDAITRLERLNTRRWNQRLQGLKRTIQLERGVNLEAAGTNSINNLLCTARLAEREWHESLECLDIENDTNRRHGRFRLAMNPPLLRFYDEPVSSRTGYFKAGTTCLASYPRSGNTLLRSLLETVTGFCTSSDTRPDRNLSVALAEKPPFFCGEGLAPSGTSSSSPFLPPESVSGGLLAPPPICKTHWPERIGCHAYDCQRVILLVRNPFDATDSYWHMNLTNTHTEKVAPSVTEEHLDFYRSLVRHEILQVWMGFLDYYWQECSSRNVPLLLVRYEDLVLFPRRELQRILEFCCKRNDRNGYDWWKERLEEVTRQADKYGYQSASMATESSRPIDSVTKETAPSNAEVGTNSHPSIGRSLRKGNFSPSLLKAIHELDYNGWLERLGYHVYEQSFPNNLTSLPPVPTLNCDDRERDICGSNNTDKSLTINVPDVSLELRPRDSPYGRNMRQWRRQRTANDRQPFPTI